MNIVTESQTKSMKNVFLLLLLLIFLSSCSDNSRNAFVSGNLWKITSKEGIESYIFGTLHIYPKNELQVSENAFTSLKKCKTLVLEFDITDAKELKKISDYNILNPSSKSDWTDALFTVYGFEELISMEIQLIEVANEYGINIIGLESADEKLSISGKSKIIEDPEQMMTNEKIIQTFQEGFKMYREENICGVKEKMLTEEPKLIELVINERNKNWVDDIAKSLQRNESFIAVGMAHLGGKNGLLNLLYEEGYKLERIK